MRSAIFDLDGTLADTSADLLAAANACFDRPWLTPGRDAALAFRGGRAMLREALTRAGRTWDEDDVDTLFAPFLAHYAARLDDETVLYPGVVPALERLQAENWSLAVCTNKPAGLAEELLRRLGLRDHFEALLGADSLPVRKPDPEHLLQTIAQIGGTPERAVLIGDTQTDRDTARNAGVPCVLVTFGPFGQSVAALEPEALLHHYDDLGATVAPLVP